MVHCLPLIADGQAVGIVQLGYAGQVPSPPTRYLGTLLAVAERASQVIRQVWTGLQNQQLAQSHLSARIQQQSRELAENGATIQRHARLVEGTDTQPLLEIRCFGSFELYRQGELITP